MKNINNKNISYLPHFTRNSLISELCERSATKAETEFRKAIRKIETSEREKRKALNLKHQFEFELELPILTTLVLNQCRNNNVDDILDVTIDLRNSRDIRKIREWFTNYQNAVDSENRESIEKFDMQLEAILEDFSNPSQSITLKSLPEFGFDISKEGGLQPSVAFSRLIELITKFWMNKDLIFLSNMNKRIKKVNYSKKEFERVFGVEFKS
jgi:hypothetical protein